MTKRIKITATLPEKVIGLLKKGVRMTNPFSVEIGDDVNLENIDGSLTIYGAARIIGGNTLISEDVKLGHEGPVTLINCRLGIAAELNGGYYIDCVFLDKAAMGSNAQVRSGCLLEEEARGNHAVGLKQTILFPFVTLGSLINFCDCLMAGGTSRKNHSEVGSSYIHFNYTPQQDKATPSLIGDVPRGVMLRENPIFLGGQGGMVGPRQIDYGTVIPAGAICRRDTHRTDLLWPAEQTKTAREGNFLPGVYGDIRHKIYKNIYYTSNLLALRQWYKTVRQEFFRKQKYGKGMYDGAILLLNDAVAERLRQMLLFSQKMETQLLADKGKTKTRKPNIVERIHSEFYRKWPQMEASIAEASTENIALKKKEKFQQIVQRNISQNNSYLEAIKTLAPAEAKIGSEWLNEIVVSITGQCCQKAGALLERKK